MAFDIVVLGSLNTDFSFSVPAFPTPGETLLADRMVASPGGKGGNQAVAAARMGKTVAMIAAIGADVRGTTLVDYLSQSDVDVDRICRRDDAPTGLATILVNAVGENLIVVDQGANRTLAPADFEGRLPAANMSWRSSKRRYRRFSPSSAPHAAREAVASSTPLLRNWMAGTCSRYVTCSS